MTWSNILYFYDKNVERQFFSALRNCSQFVLGTYVSKLIWNVRVLCSLTYSVFVGRYTVATSNFSL